MGHKQFSAIDESYGRRESSDVYSERYHEDKGSASEWRSGGIEWIA